MATTTNFGWETPDDTDLVKDGAAAMRTLGNSIDTSFVDLKGGTTGQILSKASNTDLDYTWIANDQGDITGVTATSPLTGGGTSGAITVGIQSGSTTQSGAVQLTDSTSSTSTTTAATPNSVKTSFDLANAAIPKSTATAKGNVFTATAASTPAVLTVGANGTVLTADSAEATGLKWATPSSSGGMTLISTTTLSGATVTLSSIPSTYKNLYIVIRDFLPATNNVALRMRFNADSTANRHFQTYSYGAGNFSFDVTNVALAGNSDEVIASELTIVNLYDYANTTTMKIGDNLGVDRETDGTLFRYTRTHFAYNQTGAISSLSFFLTSGNFTSGTILLYGVN
jgi:hypothetical protein